MNALAHEGGSMASTGDDSLLRVIFAWMARHPHKYEIIKDLFLAIVPASGATLWYEIVAGNGFGFNVKTILALLLTVSLGGYIIVAWQTLAERDRAEEEARRSVRDASKMDCRLRAYRLLIRNMGELVQQNAEFANYAAHGIVTTGHFSIHDGQYDSFCKRACVTLLDVLVRLYGDDSVFEVTYVMLHETPTEVGEISIETIAYAYTVESDAPRYYHVARGKLYERYFDYKMFVGGIERGDRPTVYLMTEEDVAQKLYYPEAKHFAPRSGGSELAADSLWTDEKKHKQYFAERVICPAYGETPPKMVGLLQIGVKRSPACESREEAEDLMNAYVKPVADDLLLFYKLEKGLRASPDLSKPEVIKRLFGEERKTHGTGY